MSRTPVKFGGPFDMDTLCFQMPEKRRFAMVRAIFRSISPTAWALIGTALAIGTMLGFAIHG